jgi:hypothetical protein
MDDDLRRTLIALAEHDLAVRARLAADGSLFRGYHPQMQAVHEANAAALETIIATRGWPTREFVGEDGAEAAWLIAQHAIGLPDFQRRSLAAQQSAAAAGQVPAWQPAMLLDRIRNFEGKPQLYGTQFDWDDDGQLNPLPIENPEGVDERRASVGLPPLASAIAEKRRSAANERPPTDQKTRAREMAEWAKQVGWR